ncbi:MAG: ABC transporter ATP-binding protein [Thermomicrobiales bacterium]|nr:ABC transporter ATP-binding protein [Thermomicrobiales bacterium]
MRHELTDGAPVAPVVAARDLSKHYGRVAALDTIAFTIAPGEAVALWGPNGAGKTTILRCLLGLARYQGEIRVDGLDPVTDGRAVRARIGYVPQELPVSPMTVGELTAFIARLKRVPTAAAWEKLELLGVAEHHHKAVSALSGGQRQRLSLGLALIGEPPVLLLDEPTANLDAQARAELLILLLRLRATGVTLVFSSHRPEDVLALANRVLRLETGTLLGSATPLEFQRELGGTSRMLLFLKNGGRHQAIAALADLGLDATGEDKLLTVAVQPRQKAAVLTTLAAAGVELDDFDLERVAWTDRS